MTGTETDRTRSFFPPSLFSFLLPNYRRVNESSVKVRVMDLMSHPDPEVKYRALGAVSKLISASWR